MVQKPHKQLWLEKYFELFLLQSRFIVLPAVIFGLISTLILFILASVNVVSVFEMAFNFHIRGIQSTYFLEEVVSTLIGAVDLYLIGVVLLIFSFGMYELFISKIDVSDIKEHSGSLHIKSLDELKNKITKVIIVVLVVTFFQNAVVMKFSSPLDMFFLAISIAVLSIGLYFLYKTTKHTSHGLKKSRRVDGL